jgi:hypothetical protein
MSHVLRRGHKAQGQSESSKAVFTEEGKFDPADPMDPLAKFTKTEQKIIRAKYQHRTLNQAEIASLLGISRVTVSRCFSGEEIAAICAWIDKDKYARVADVQDEAIDNLRAWMNDTNVDMAIRARIALSFVEPLIQSKEALPPPNPITALVFSDPGRPDIEPEFTGRDSQ